MARVEEWIGAFIEHHTARLPRSDWPPTDSEYWEFLTQAFVQKGVIEDVADEASRRLALEPPAHLDLHFRDFFALVVTIWRERNATAQAALDEREAALLASKACDDCGGVTGFATRWRKLSTGRVDEQGRKLPDYVLLYCRCPYGRWLEHAHRSRSPEIRQRFNDLLEHPFLWGDEYRNPAYFAGAEPDIDPEAFGETPEF